MSHGLLVGRRQGTIRTPASLPLSLTRRLWALIQPLSSWLLCQEALSQIRSKAFLPLCWSLWQHQERNCVVMELTGRPSTNLSQVSVQAPADKARSRRVLWARDRPFWLPSRGGGPALWHPPRNAQKVARSEKTSSRPRNPEPTPDGSRPAGSADLDPLFSGILRIGAFYPAFGPLPAHPQS